MTRFELVKPSRVGCEIIIIMQGSSFHKVFDDRKRRVRGLWKRNGWFYARLATVDAFTGHKSTKRVRLETRSLESLGRGAIPNESGGASYFAPL